MRLMSPISLVLVSSSFNKEIKSSIYSFSCLVSSRIREIFKSKAKKFEFIALQNDV